MQIAEHVLASIGQSIIKGYDALIQIDLFAILELEEEATNLKARNASTYAAQL
ncbi:MAG: hypothetical protein ALECFALPRED_009125 [Alectoria fallacina]|uniref:Uncharacterized protein n=1 Tax=Alectoria fallacina TaxID=1903189 RepID=A0A8H3I3Q4_9LECA|nr:MAG: hypothetical protein ALECFALPRED_009125 [Alectoria fallacina]